MPTDLQASPITGEQPASTSASPELNFLLPEGQIDQPFWRSLRAQVRELLHPTKTAPLTLTSKPVRVRLIGDDVSAPLWISLPRQIKDRLFPEKTAPLELTSRPVRVKPIWEEDQYKNKSAMISAIAHCAFIGGIILVSVLGARVVKKVQQQQSVTLIAPDLSGIMPVVPDGGGKKLQGGGGGGDRDKIQAPKGKLPKFSMEQITPPAVVIRNDHPKLAVEPTVVMPPNVKLPVQNNMPSLGDPIAGIPNGPPSNGTGSGGGIGSGSGGGVGSGEGGGVGPGKGGGFGGGVFQVGKFGVSAPRAIYTPDPEYSEEARKAKYQGTVVLWLIVDPSGRPRDIRVSRSLGLGLDQKAVEAVRQWKFEPAKKDGQPVAVQINVEVNFRLY
ncbi:MAG TPA: energy transducer TonB [Terriglobales bacterium]|nr:energy transducer TonB [Terriglobales bacterium]